MLPTHKSQTAPLTSESSWLPEEEYFSDKCRMRLEDAGCDGTDLWSQRLAGRSRRIRSSRLLLANQQVGGQSELHGILALKDSRNKNSTPPNQKKKGEREEKGKRGRTRRRGQGRRREGQGRKRDLREAKPDTFTYKLLFMSGSCSPSLLIFLSFATPKKPGP